jgi:hypothetical protein
MFKVCDNKDIMRSVITRFPVLISATFVLITSIVFAQVLPEEPAVESPEDIVLDTPEQVTSEQDMVLDPEFATTSPEETLTVGVASSTDEIPRIQSESESSTQALVSSSSPLSETPREEPVKNTIFSAEDEVRSLRELERPQQCQSEGVKNFFDTIGECVRYVTAKISESKREPFEDRLAEQPPQLGE